MNDTNDTNDQQIPGHNPSVEEIMQERIKLVGNFTKSLQNTIAEAETVGVPMSEIFNQLSFWAHITMTQIVEMAKNPPSGSVIN